MSDINLKLAEHKAVSPVVFAFKISSIVELEDGRTVLAPAGDGFLALIASEEVTQKYKAQVGDYFVASKTAQTILSSDIFEDPNFGFAPVANVEGA